MTVRAFACHPPAGLPPAQGSAGGWHGDAGTLNGTGRYSTFRPILERAGISTVSRRGMARLGRAGLGQARQGAAGHGRARQGEARTDQQRGAPEWNSESV